MSRWTIIETEDASHSLRDTIYGDKFHSREGSIQESKFIYIENGAKRIEEGKKEIKIFEMGFGTGLNALLFALYSLKSPELKTTYHSLELHPLPPEIWNKLNFAEQLDSAKSQSIFDMLHESDWDKNILMDGDFEFRKTEGDIKNHWFTDSYDMVIYDAFGPRYQPELWKKDIFENIFDHINPGGFLITYCAMGQFKRDLKSIGFLVESPPGPPGKRQITVAFKPKA